MLTGSPAFREDRRGGDTRSKESEMAVALILDFPGGGRAQYDSVVAKMDLGGRMPDGGMFHAAGAYAHGWRVVDVWQDLATFERFRDAKIVPLADAAGMGVPNVDVIEVAEQKRGSGATAELVQVVRLPGLDALAFRAADLEILSPYRGRAPEAITFHVNGPCDGGWCVVDAWSSKEARDRFIEERVKPVMREADLTGPPVIEELMVAATLRAGALTHA
jgi:hypothetical protein